jgi:hypothetical protein
VPVPELPFWNQTCELEQTAPHQASRADEVKQCVLREHRPALALPALEHFVAQRRRSSSRQVP